ncbi:hypothetical protein T10_9426 [Trichinella papuae]|uniref:Uncharacterized protein n=1 Tax=Trichinella papuae TaxID=268474 RepID=A0A0V1MAV7_9BILA|nr:hypothetical protein T10_9426 [Trichinella papuae]
MLVIRPLLTRSFVTSISDVSLLAPSRRTPPPQFTYNVCRLERRFLAGKIEILLANYIFLSHSFLLTTVPPEAFLQAI